MQCLITSMDSNVKISNKSVERIWPNENGNNDNKNETKINMNWLESYGV